MEYSLLQVCKEQSVLQPKKADVLARFLQMCANPSSMRISWSGDQSLKCHPCPVVQDPVDLGNNLAGMFAWHQLQQECILGLDRFLHVLESAAASRIPISEDDDDDDDE